MESTVGVFKKELPEILDFATQSFWLIVWFIYGNVLFGFMVLPVIIQIVFFVPLSISLKSQGKLTSWAPVTNPIISICLLTGFSLLATQFALSHFSWSFIVGVIVTFLFSLGQWGSNKNNMLDYIDRYGHNFTEGTADELIALVSQRSAR